ncbi:MAG TPA: hypothetical protein ENK55_03410 [Actinobacteria bacterium]|nr:hypothetical protein [Actinomycetota bacterium]
MRRRILRFVVAAAGAAFVAVDRGGDDRRIRRVCDASGRVEAHGAMGRPTKTIRRLRRARWPAVRA